MRFPFESFTKNSTEINCLSSIKRRKKTLYYFLACAQYSATPLSVLECAMRCEGGGRARQGRTEQGLWGRSGLSSAFHVSAAVVAIAERIFWRDAFGILTCRLCCASLLRMRSLSKCCQLCVSLRSASLARCLIAHTPCGLATKKAK